MGYKFNDLKVKHAIPLVILIITAFVIFKYVYNPKPPPVEVKKVAKKVAEKVPEKVQMKEEVESKEERIEKDMHIPEEHLDITKFTKAEKHKEKEGCTVVEHCEHLQCAGPEYDRIIRFKEDGCRECVCIL